MVIKLYELRGKNPDLIWSCNPWKSRMCLNLKGIEFESIPLTYLEIHSVLPEVLHKTEGCTVPVLVDNEMVIQDSFKIAQYLDENYPGPSIFYGGLALQEFAYNWMERAILFPLFKLTILDIADKLDEGSKEYFLTARTQMFGNLTQLTAVNRDENINYIQANLDYLLENLKTHKFISGEEIGLVDISLASFLHMTFLMNEDVFNVVTGSANRATFTRWWKDMKTLIR